MGDRILEGDRFTGCDQIQPARSRHIGLWPHEFAHVEADKVFGRAAIPLPVMFVGEAADVIRIEEGHQRGHGIDTGVPQLINHANTGSHRLAGDYPCSARSGVV